MFIKSLSTKTVVLGLFLLIWSLNAYIIGGNLTKYLSLFGGFTILFLVYFIQKEIHNRDIGFFFKSIFFYILYLSIAVLKKQNLDNTGFVFSMICFWLLNIGYYLGSHNLTKIKLNKKYIVILSFLSFLGAITFYRKQSGTFKTISSEISRSVGDSFLNPNGVAYTQSLLFIFLFWLLFQTKDKRIKLITFTSIIGVLLILFMTSARGATLALVLFLAMFYFNGIKNSKKVIFTFLGYSILFSFVIGVFVYLAKSIPFIYSKLELLYERFLSLIGFVSEQGHDYSIDERTQMYEGFFSNWQDYLLGMENYIGYPHNIYLEIFMRWGVLGFPLVFLITKYFLKSHKFISKDFLTGKNSIIFLLASLFIFSFLQSLTSLNLEMNRCLWLSLGFLIGFNANKSVRI